MMCEFPRFVTLAYRAKHTSQIFECLLTHLENVKKKINASTFTHSFNYQNDGRYVIFSLSVTLKYNCGDNASANTILFQELEYTYIQI